MYWTDHEQIPSNGIRQIAQWQVSTRVDLVAFRAWRHSFLTLCLFLAPGDVQVSSISSFNYNSTIPWLGFTWRGCKEAEISGRSQWRSWSPELEEMLLKEDPPTLRYWHYTPRTFSWHTTKAALPRRWRLKRTWIKGNLQITSVINHSVSTTPSFHQNHIVEKKWKYVHVAAWREPFEIEHDREPFAAY